jgi:F0F1-type ATP synthase membrane subunit c/vacuolar-type H+-ATPase subunit K
MKVVIAATSAVQLAHCLPNTESVVGGGTRNTSKRGLVIGFFCTGVGIALGLTGGTTALGVGLSVASGFVSVVLQPTNTALLNTVINRKCFNIIIVH